jgi:hypothetical protein
MCKDCPFTVSIWTLLHQDDVDSTALHGYTFDSTSAWWDAIIEGKSVSTSVVSVDCFGMPKKK